jgi:hypothetical protein
LPCLCCRYAERLEGQARSRQQAKLRSLRFESWQGARQSRTPEAAQQQQAGQAQPAEPPPVAAGTGPGGSSSSSSQQRMAALKLQLPKLAVVTAEGQIVQNAPAGRAACAAATECCLLPGRQACRACASRRVPVPPR